MISHRCACLVITLALLGITPACSDGNGNRPDADAGTDPIEETGDPTADPVDDTCVVDSYCMTDDVACLDGACHAPPYATTCLGGHLVDSTGAPKVCQAVVACTEGTCFFGRSDADGWFTVPIGATSHPDISIYFPVPMEGTGHHSPFCHYTELCDDEVHLCTPFVLYDAPTTGEAVPESTGPTDPNPLPADVRVEASDGGALVFHAGDEVDLPIFTDPWVALSRFPLDDHVPCFIDPDSLPLALYAFTPMDALVIEPGTHLDPVFRFASLDLPNETGLAADTAVDIYLLGGVHPLDAGLFEGEWTRVVGAAVTSDGTRIQTADGEGLGYLTWIGVYLP
ncbi:MAG: hypothetical protein JRG91_09150 [Deltaproteobacteria bacterium]|nr:hypothetical protein [Deltaproteobacteria bacterium]